MKCLSRLRKNSKGATAVEYGLILALIALASIGAFRALASTVTSMWNGVADNVTIASS